MKMTSPAAIKDPEDNGVRARILTAARRVFARYGLRGASVRDIAAGAGVTPAMINYHFRGKGGLYHEVVEEAMGRLMAHLSGALAAAGDQPLDVLDLNNNPVWTAPDADLGVAHPRRGAATPRRSSGPSDPCGGRGSPSSRLDLGASCSPGPAHCLCRAHLAVALAGAYFDFLCEEQDLQRLLMHEVLASGEPMQEVVSRHMGPLRALIQGRLAGDQDGRVLQAAVSLFGAVAGYFLYAPVLGQLTGKDPLDPEQLDARRRHVEALAAQLAGQLGQENASK